MQDSQLPFVTVNSPLAITSSDRFFKFNSSNLSAGAQTALNSSSSAGAGISIVNGVNTGGSTSYNVASGASAVTSSGSSSSSIRVSGREEIGTANNSGRKFYNYI